jgi:hypothetical protein
MASATSSSSSAQNAGRGSSSASSATQSSSTSTTTSKVSANCGDLPACAADMFLSCLPSGSCALDLDGSTPNPQDSLQTKTCFANGVEIDYAQIAGTWDAGVPWTTTQFNAGVGCFSSVSHFPTAAGRLSVPSGAVRRRALPDPPLDVRSRPLLTLRRPCLRLCRVAFLRSPARSSSTPSRPPVVALVVLATRWDRPWSRIVADAHPSARETDPRTRCRRRIVHNAHKFRLAHGPYALATCRHRLLADVIGIAYEPSLARDAVPGVVAIPALAARRDSERERRATQRETT